MTQESQVDSKNFEFGILNSSEFIRVFHGGCELSLSGILFTEISMDKSSILLHSSFLAAAPLSWVTVEL